MVGSKIYENDSYLRAVVGNYRESGAMQFKKFEFLFISPEDPFGKLFSKTVTIFKSSSEAPFLWKIEKFKIGLNLEIMQIRAFSKRSYEKTKGSLFFIFTRFDTHFSKLPSSYILSWFRIFFYFLHPYKECNVSSFVDTVNFTIFQKVIASRLYIYIYLAVVKIVFWKKHAFFLYVILIKAFFWPVKIERARRKCIKRTLITISPFLIYSANIASKSDILASLTAHFSALDHNYLFTRYHGMYLWWGD